MPSPGGSSHDIPEVGRFVCVYGPSGSGKTTVAREIGSLLRLPVVELDALFHRPNWQPTPVEEFRAKVVDALDELPDGWVCDGNYGSVRDLVLPRADTIIWLRLPFRVVYWRLVKRTITRAWSKEPLWNTNYESWRLTFLSRDSILLWGLTNWRPHPKKMMRDLDSIPHRAPVLQLRSANEVRRFLGSLDRSTREGR